MKKRIFTAICVMVMCVMGLCSANAQKNGIGKGANVPEGVTDGTKPSVPEGVTDGTKPSVAAETMKMNGETGDVSFVVVYDKKKEELWGYCRRWMAETFQNYNSIKQLEDRQSGMLICNYVTGLYAEGQKGGFFTRWKGTNKWKMTITCKDQRLRVQMTEYSAAWEVQGKSSMGSWMPALKNDNISFVKAKEDMGEELFGKQFDKVVAGTIGNIIEALGKYGSEEDF